MRVSFTRSSHSQDLKRPKLLSYTRRPPQQRQVHHPLSPSHRPSNSLTNSHPSSSKQPRLLRSTRRAHLEHRKATKCSNSCSHRPPSATRFLSSNSLHRSLSSRSSSKCWQPSSHSNSLCSSNSSSQRTLPSCRRPMSSTDSSSRHNSSRMWPHQHSHLKRLCSTRLAILPRPPRQQVSHSST